MASLVFTPSAGSGWTNSNNIVSEDSIYATVIVPSMGTSTVLLSTLNLTALPDSATINGLQVDVKGYGNSSLSGTFQFFDGATLTKSLGTLPSSNSWVTVGGASDLWGQTSITAARLKNAAAEWRYSCSNRGLFTSYAAYCDAIKVTIYYTNNAQNTYAMMIGFSM